MCVCVCGVQGSFDHRMKAWQRWQDAQAVLQKKRETEAKLLWANKPDKLQLAKEEIAEVEQQPRSTQWNKSEGREEQCLNNQCCPCIILFLKTETPTWLLSLLLQTKTHLNSAWLFLFKYWITSTYQWSSTLFISPCWQWEAKVTQYERDFERVSATVRKEVVRFEVWRLFSLHVSVTGQLETFIKDWWMFCYWITQKEKAKNFKRQVIKYLEALLQSQQQVSVSVQT